MAARVVLVVVFALVVGAAASSFERSEEDLCLGAVVPEPTETSQSFSFTPPGRTCVYELPDGSRQTDEPRLAPFAWSVIGAAAFALLLLFGRTRESEPVRAAVAALIPMTVAGLFALAGLGFFLPFLLGGVVGVPIALVVDGGRRIAPALYGEGGLIALAFFTLAGLQSLALWAALLLVMGTAWATRFARRGALRPASPRRR